MEEIFTKLIEYAEKHPGATEKECMDAVCPGIEIEIIVAQPLSSI